MQSIVIYKHPSPKDGAWGWQIFDASPQELTGYLKWYFDEVHLYSGFYFNFNELMECITIKHIKDTVAGEIHYAFYDYELMGVCGEFPSVFFESLEEWIEDADLPKPMPAPVESKKEKTMIVRR